MEADENILKASTTNFEIFTEEDLLKSQLCSSCEKEKATVICSICTSQNKPSNSDSIPALKVYTPDNSPDQNIDNYYQNNYDLIINKEENPTETNVDKLMRKGNLVYCTECFKVIHEFMDKLVASKHIPVEIFSAAKEDLEESDSMPIDDSQSEELSQINLIVEDRIESLIEQVVNNTEKQVKLEREYFKIDKFFSEISSLNQRCKQFNDVKSSIKQMNDIIRDDLHVDFGSAAQILNSKLEELSDKIKEKLKDAYSVVRDIQVKITEKINEVDSNLKELERMRQDAEIRAQEMRNKEAEILTQIQQINDELKSICEPNFANNNANSSTFSCSLFVDNNLYPQFNYHVDLSKLIEAINDLNVQIGPNTGGQKAIIQSMESNLNLVNNLEFNATIQSSLSNDGTFWIQFVAPLGQDAENTNILKNSFHKSQLKLNMFIEEINRFIRSKRIGDKEWQTFAELNRMPKENEKCFSLEPKTRKWLRSKVLKVDCQNKECQVRYLDTGVTDSNTLNSFEDMLPWRDFDLVKLPYRAFKCALFKQDSEEKFEKDIFPETRFLFKDLTSNRRIKCILVEQIDGNNNLVVNYSQGNDESSEDKIWIAKIYAEYEGEKKMKNINDIIIKKNANEKILTKVKYYYIFKIIQVLKPLVFININYTWLFIFLK